MIGFTLQPNTGSPSNPKQFKLSELYNYKNPKPKLKSKNKLTNHHENQLKIVSPFFNRNCKHSGVCKCPYHPMKNVKATPLISYRKCNSTLTSFYQAHQQMKIKTEGNQESRFHTTMNKYKGSAFILKKYGKNFNEIEHKVKCRNSEFQDFLHKNKLYILTGKLQKTNKSREDKIYEELLDQICSEGSEGNLQSEGRGKNKENRKYFQYQKNRRITKLNLGQSGNKKNAINNLQRIRVVVEAILKGTRKISIFKAKALCQYFEFEIDEEIAKNQHLQNLQQLRELVEKFRNFINSQHRSSSKNSSLARSNCEESQFVKNESNERVSMEGSSKNISHLSRQNRRVSIIQRDSKNKKNKKISGNQSLNNKQNSENDYNDYSFEFNCESQKNEQLEDAQNASNSDENEEQKRRKKPTSKLKMRNNKTPLKTVAFDRTHSEHSQEKEYDNKTDHFLNNEPLHLNILPEKGSNKNKRVKLNEILNKKYEPALDRRLLKMKKYIERNRQFIRKVEKRLYDLNLGLFVIEAGDSLITRKKKIRCLKEMMMQHGTHKNEFYEQVMKYLNIYTEHCNLVLRKQNTVDVNFEYLDEELMIGDLHKDKNLSDSLKFINLEQIPKEEKQQKLEGWISIPQYITQDETRVKKCAKMQSFKSIVEQCAPKFEQNLSESDDSLIQAEMKNKCSVRFYSTIEQVAYQPRLRPMKNKSVTKIVQPFSPFAYKLERFRKKLFGKDDLSAH